MNIKELQDKLQRFTDERDWDQFHTPKNLVMALSGEVGELTEIFQWLTEEQSKAIVMDMEKMKQVEEEIADIQVYVLRLAHKLGVDIERAVEKKMRKNAEKYPVHLAKGNAKKYTEY
ncbi:MAG TPA: nucleotide pyrophosphohydrolase [Thermodesulfovibrionia bacterium]|nr:nucleotide pyrophosphohydrolase [Thermodesulfovibrionia bacterium]